jgi:hypothetical protein
VNPKYLLKNSFADPSTYLSIENSLTEIASWRGDPFVNVLHVLGVTDSTVENLALNKILFFNLKSEGI